MSNIKLKGATSGESILKAPAVAGTDTTITLPKASIDLSTAGTDGQFLKTDGEGTLSFATVSGGAALANDANNRVVTADGSGGINGEANLEFNGTTLKFGKTPASLITTDTSDGSDNKYLLINGGGDASDTRGAMVSLYGNEQGSWEGRLELHAGNSGNANGNIRIYTGGSSRLEVSSAGDVEVKTGNLVMGTSGKGIDFSATSDGTNMSSELLDDYEEGKFDATFANSVTAETNVRSMEYTRIGRQVTVTGEFRIDSDNSDSDLNLNNLPFASTSADDSGSMAASACVTHDHDFAHGQTVFAYIMEGSAAIRFLELQDNGGYVNANADSGAYYCVSLTYFTS